MSLKERERDIFLLHFEENGQKATAAQVAGVSLSTINQAIRSDMEFAAQYEEALSRFRDTLEAEIHRRAVKGTPEHVFHMGVAVKDPNDPDKKKPYVKLNYSDSLLALMAKRHIPEYSDKNTGDGEVAAKVMVVPGGLTADDWAEKYSSLASAQQKAKDDADNEAEK